jgi:hypothetical protein
MLKFPLASAVLIGCAMVTPVHAQQPLSAALDNPATRLGVQERCTEASIDVTAASVDERRLACDAAAQALQLLARCTIAPRRPLRIELSNEVQRPFGGRVFGMFDPRQEKVLITRYEQVASLASGTPFSQLPQHEFYKSLIVHEVVHGVLHQNYKKRPGSYAAYEYPAYALQIESLPSDVRKTLLQTVNIGASESEFAFNDAILAFDPFFFAARAYQHFRASADGCTHLHALLEGEVAFIWAPPLTR